MNATVLKELVRNKFEEDAIEILPTCIEHIDKELKDYAESAETEWHESKYKKPRRRSPEIVYANNPELFYRICKHYKDNGLKVVINSPDVSKENENYEGVEISDGPQWVIGGTKEKPVDPDYPNGKVEVDNPPYYYRTFEEYRSWEKRVEWDENFDLKEFKNGLEDNVKYPPSIYIGLFWDN